MKTIDRLGKKFGRLTIDKVIGMKYGSHAIVRCSCECGGFWEGLIECVIRGDTRSCGCFGKENPSRLKHGFAKTRFYGIYNGIHQRITNKNVKTYSHYGGRGIKMLWASFEDFHRDMYASYLENIAIYGEKETTIERNNVDDDYCLENCRWATHLEQMRNQRKSRLFTFNGETKCLSEWAVIFLLPPGKVFARLSRGWTAEEAFGLTSRKKS